MASPNLTAVRDMLLTIAPELSSRPLYLIDLSEHLDMAEACAGGVAVDCWPVNSFDLPGWTGPGALIGVDCAQYKREPVRNAIWLHECAHILPALPAREFERMTTIRTKEAEGVDVLDTVGEGLREEPDSRHETLILHNPIWQRRVVHLYVRAVAAGYDVHPRALLGYGWLPSFREVLDLFLVDALRMPTANFDDIDRLPLSHETTVLFEAAKQRFSLIHKKLTEVNP